MVRYGFYRCLHSIPALLGVTLVAFVLLHASGDVTYVLLPPEATPEQRMEFRRIYALDQPVSIQFGRYLSHLIRGDFGRSLMDGRPALRVVFEHVPATVELTAAAMVIGVSLAIPAGVLSAVRKDHLLDGFVTVFILLAQSVPTFWFGMLLILGFAVHWHLFPVSGRGAPAQLFLPSLTLAMWPLTLTARLTRSGMLEALSEDYIRTARAKGLPEAAVAWRHALRNALLPIITVLGINLGSMLGGAVLTETVFAWPGVGTLMLAAVLAHDYPVVLAVLIVVATVFVMLSLIADLLYGLLDPRIRVTYGD